MYNGLEKILARAIDYPIGETDDDTPKTAILRQRDAKIGLYATIKKQVIQVKRNTTERKTTRRTMMKILNYASNILLLMMFIALAVAFKANVASSIASVC